MEAYCRGLDNLSVQLGIHPIRISSVAFFQKQLLKNIFTPHIFLKLLIHKYLILVMDCTNTLAGH